MRMLPLALLLALAAPAARAADLVVLLPATGANVSDGELMAATDLLRGDLEQTGRFTVLLAERQGGNVPEPTPSEAAYEARLTRASLAVTLRLSRLGSSIMARLAAHRPDGSLWHADQLGAAHADDLEPALKRLAQGLAEIRSAAKLAQIDTVTEREARPLNKIPACHVRGIRLGAAWFTDRPGGGDARVMTGGGLFWLYDARSFLAEIAIDYAGAGSTQPDGGDHLLSVGLSGYVPLTRSDVAPYLGGGLDYGLVHTQRDLAAGLTFRGACGVLVGRTTTVNFRVEGGYRLTAYTLEANGERKAVQGPFVTLGLGI